MRPIKIVIVDRNIITRKGLVAILTEIEESHEILATFANLWEVRTVFPHHIIDILILDDLAAHPTEIVCFIKQWHETQPGLSIIILSERRDPDYIRSVMRFGTASYILKSVDLYNQLLTAAKMMSAKYPFISPKALGLMSGDAVKTLEPRDKEVLQLLAQELTIKEIGVELKLTTKTVYRIRSRLKRILGIRNNEMIVDAARKKGFLSNID
ncbi:MAG: LuxR C-terminal-related transcriptional regulator [Chloroflexota bacterium]